MVQQLRGWIDYDRRYLSPLLPTERLDYFEKRVRLVAINPLDRLLSNEIHVSPDSSALLLCGVSLCCVIEATGKFLMGGHGGNPTRFEAFLKAYMSPDYQSKKLGTMTYGQVLWRHFRNGLTHGFAVCHGGFEGNRGESYFSVRDIAGHDSLMVNPYLLYDDYVNGFGKYLSDLRAASPASQLFLGFNAVFELVFIQGK